MNLNPSKASKLFAVSFATAAIALAAAAQAQDASGARDSVAREDAHPSNNQPVSFTDAQSFRVLETLLDFSDEHGVTAAATERIQTGQLTIKYRPPAGASRPSASVQPNTSADSTAGYADCDIRAHNPHAGQGPGGVRMVKAKANGDCTFTWTGPAYEPPVIVWNLYMLLREGGDTVGSVRHPREGEEVDWEQNGPNATQVFHDEGACENGYYTNAISLHIILPAGWYLSTTTNPVATASRSASVGNC